MAMLTFAIGHGWTSVFGDTLLSLRLLARLCYLVTVALPLWYFYRKTADAAWTFLLGAFMLALVQADHILFYGWDVGAFPFISALLVGLLCYLDRPTVARATVCGALCALMILSRVTTAVAGIPALFWIIVCCRSSGRNAAFERECCRLYGGMERRQYHQRPRRRRYCRRLPAVDEVRHTILLELYRL